MAPKVAPPKFQQKMRPEESLILKRVFGDSPSPAPSTSSSPEPPKPKSKPRRKKKGPKVEEEYIPPPNRPMAYSLGHMPLPVYPYQDEPLPPISTGTLPTIETLSQRHNYTAGIPYTEPNYPTQSASIDYYLEPSPPPHPQETSYFPRGGYASLPASQMMNPPQQPSTSRIIDYDTGYSYSPHPPVSERISPPLQSSTSTQYPSLTASLMSPPQELRITDYDTGSYQYSPLPAVPDRMRAQQPSPSTLAEFLSLPPLTERMSPPMQPGSSNNYASQPSQQPSPSNFAGYHPLLPVSDIMSAPIPPPEPTTSTVARCSPLPAPGMMNAPQEPSISGRMNDGWCQRSPLPGVSSTNPTTSLGSRLPPLSLPPLALAPLGNSGMSPPLYPLEQSSPRIPPGIPASPEVTLPQMPKPEIQTPKPESVNPLPEHPTESTTNPLAQTSKPFKASVHPLMRKFRETKRLLSRDVIRIPWEKKSASLSVEERGKPWAKTFLAKSYAKLRNSRKGRKMKRVTLTHADLHRRQQMRLIRKEKRGEQLSVDLHLVKKRHLKSPRSPKKPKAPKTPFQVDKTDLPAQSPTKVMPGAVPPSQPKTKRSPKLPVTSSALVSSGSDPILIEETVASVAQLQYPMAMYNPYAPASEPPAVTNSLIPHYVVENSYQQEQPAVTNMSFKQEKKRRRAANNQPPVQKRRRVESGPLQPPVVVNKNIFRQMDVKNNNYQASPVKNVVYQVKATTYQPPVTEPSVTNITYQVPKASNSTYQPVVTENNNVYQPMQNSSFAPPNTTVPRGTPYTHPSGFYCGPMARAEQQSVSRTPMMNSPNYGASPPFYPTDGAAPSGNYENLGYSPEPAANNAQNIFGDKQIGNVEQLLDWNQAASLPVISCDDWDSIF